MAYGGLAFLVWSLAAISKKPEPKPEPKPKKRAA